MGENCVPLLLVQRVAHKGEKSGRRNEACGVRGVRGVRGARGARGARPLQLIGDDPSTGLG